LRRDVRQTRRLSWFHNWTGAGDIQLHTGKGQPVILKDQNRETVFQRGFNWFAQLDLKNFFQEHGLKVIFTLATVLVLVALRNMIAWKEVGAVAVRLVPVVLLGLTGMFWLFGQKTREENPWAAFVYHGLSAALPAFDVFAIHRYWMGDALAAKPVFLMACAAATAASVFFTL